MAKKLIESEYQGLQFHFSEEAWFNATEVAEQFGKKPSHFLDLDSTKEYITVLCEILNAGKTGIIKTRRGKHGGTWFHSKLAVAFARWLDIRFAIWCDLQIDQIIRGNHPYFEWKQNRHQSQLNHKMVMESLRLEWHHQGKASEARHYINEARLINWAISGQFRPVKRDELNSEELDLLAKLEVHDAILIARGFDYPARKKALEAFVVEQGS